MKHQSLLTILLLGCIYQTSINALTQENIKEIFQQNNLYQYLKENHTLFNLTESTNIIIKPKL